LSSPFYSAFSLTNLFLTVYRSLLHGSQWWDYLTRQELPAWILYERGGGRATKCAAEAWLGGREPWSPDEKTDRKRYFEAGGNGVAMRIMPHCLLNVAEAEFGAVARNIVANGVCTHGHPRALVGSLAYGFAVWLVYRETHTLPYGAIIGKTLAEVESWSVLPELDEIWPTWRRSAEEVHSGQYREHWQMAVAEMRQLLTRCQDAMTQGALSIDQQVLTQLGCFDRKVNGAGTIAAAASIFLASRYATDPFHGLMEAAFAYGADTDTIASMTGGLLGAVAGLAWLGDHAAQVQDAQYLRMLGERLAGSRDNKQKMPEDIPKITRVALDSLLEKLEASKPTDTVILPNGNEAQISAPQLRQTRSKTLQVLSWELITTDGQSLYIKKSSRHKAGTDAKARTHYDSDPNTSLEVGLHPVEIVKAGVELLVRDMEKSRLFYAKVLGLKIEKESRNSVNLGGIIALVSSDHKKSIVQQPKEVTRNHHAIIFLKTRSLEAAYDNLKRFGATIQTPISQTREQRFFRCFDPDGNLVEIFEVVGNS
jgi:ADP-ribosylglycohydrolase/predicted enzyme related to lactoylglutathione lyase